MYLHMMFFPFLPISFDVNDAQFYHHYLNDDDDRIQL